MTAMVYSKPHPEVSYAAEEWVIGDSRLMLDATVRVHVSDIQVTLIDAVCSYTGKRVQYWQRTALIEWVACHQHLLRRLQPLWGEPGFGKPCAAEAPGVVVASCR